jgi:hypothetical protein
MSTLPLGSKWPSTGGSPSAPSTTGTSTGSTSGWWSSLTSGSSGNFWSNLIGAGLSLFGGGRSDAARLQINRQNLRESRHQFDQQMDQSVYRRVQDAIRAGVHPLFALGASVGASPTVDGTQTSGSGMGDALQQIGAMIQGLPAQRAGIERDRAAARRDDAESAYLNSLAKRTEQGLASTGRDGQGGVRTYPLPDRDPMGEAIYFEPEIPKSQRPGVAAGSHPSKIQLTREDGRTITIPNPDLGLDEIGQVEYVVKNVRLWATDRIEDIADWIKNDSPSDAEVRRLEKQLQMWKQNPEKMAEFERRYRGFVGKVADYWRRFHRR